MTLAPHAAAPGVLPSFFGDPRRQLFGVYHEPRGDVVRDAGVVLCHPAPQEYRHTHWAFHKLAGLLADRGFHVLRFDYFATGDSAGESHEGSLAQWTADIAAAAAELRDVAGVRNISLVGMRLGAALAVRAAAGVKARDLVLWDPVVRGADYLAHLGVVEDARLAELYYPEPNRRLPGELLGYPMPDVLRDETCAVDLLDEPLWARVAVTRVPRRLLVIDAVDRPEHAALHARVEAAGITTTRAVVDDPALYGGGIQPGDTLLAHRVPVAIADFLAQGAA